MTQQRRDLITFSGSLYQRVDDDRFMDRLRNIPYLDSKTDHINAMDIDGSIWNYNNNKFLWVEMKKNRAEPSWSQTSHLNMLSASLCLTPNFNGIFLIQHKDGGIENGSWVSVLNDNKWTMILNKDDMPVNFDKDKIFGFIKYILGKE